jgi:hypothetical protein
MVVLSVKRITLPAREDTRMASAAGVTQVNLLDVADWLGGTKEASRKKRLVHA